MNNLFKIITGLSVAVVFASCTKNLDRKPNTGLYADDVYATIDGYKAQLVKVYSAFALTGGSGPASSDLGGIDAGTSDFLRLYWNAQELSTDEAICAWNDPGVPDFHNMNWTSGNTILTGLYNRCLYQVALVNSFLSESTDAKLSSRGITQTDSVKRYIAEARFLRAYQYSVLMDLFGSPPFVTENDPIGGSFLPKQISRSDLFNYIESELKAIEPDLADPRTNEYGRADKAAEWALLARIYLNATVYTGKDHYADALTYAQKVISAGYSLKSDYKELFYADNNVNNPEIILPINYDALNTQNYGGTTFLVNSAINGDMNPASFGVPSGGWGGNRTTENLPDLFPNTTDVPDGRSLFYGDKKEIDVVATFTDGLRTTKWRNINSDGSLPANAGTFASIDFPLFRLAEMYLVYAEAQLRGGGGSKDQAIQYFNLLRQRAYGNATGNVVDITLDDVLNERARELYWEGFRRTDLIRYNRFTSSSYIWPWKGGIKDGTGVADKYNLFPLPSTDIIANPNLTQNTGY
jgi:hypothetical protein